MHDHFYVSVMNYNPEGVSYFNSWKEAECKEMRVHHILVRCLIFI